MKKEDKQMLILKRLMTAFCDEEEKFLTNQIIKDIQDNPEKYKDVVVYPIERKKIIDLIKKGKEFENIEKQLAEKDEEIKQYCERAIIDMNYKEMLELQLDKADKEIEKQKDQVEILKHKLSEKMETQLLGVAKDKIKEIRHQVCEEIRKRFDNEYYWCYGDNHNNIVIAQEDFNIILDQIEKGE